MRVGSSGGDDDGSDRDGDGGFQNRNLMGTLTASRSRQRLRLTSHAVSLYTLGSLSISVTNQVYIFTLIHTHIEIYADTNLCKYIYVCVDEVVDVNVNIYYTVSEYAILIYS